MACSDEKLACCRLCKMPVASKRGECPHCGACKPVAEAKSCFWHVVLFVLLAVGTLMATLQFDARRPSGLDCGFQDIRQGGC